MADTTTNTVTNPSVKKYVDYAQNQVDEQAILDKYNAATIQQYNVQREQNRQAENQFYNQMYNTQKTALDTIRQSNAAAVANGASRGVQAANELAAILGLQQESVESATELAQANRQTAQEETAAVLENVLNAYNQAVQERQQLVSQGIEAASVDAQEAANQIEAMNAESNRMQAEATKAQAETQANQTQADIASALVSAAENGTAAYLAALQKNGIDYSKEVSDDAYASLNMALQGISKDVGGAGTAPFKADDWKWDATGKGKAENIESKIKQICATYGLTYDGEISAAVNTMKDTAKKDASWISWFSGVKASRADYSNTDYATVLRKVQEAYYEKLINNNK